MTKPVNMKLYLNSQSEWTCSIISCLLLEIIFLTSTQLCIFLLYPGEGYFIWTCSFSGIFFSMLALSRWYLLWKCVVDIWPIFKSVTFNDMFLPRLFSRSPTWSKWRNSFVLMDLNDAFGPAFCLCLIVDILLVKTTVEVSRK